MMKQKCKHILLFVIFAFFQSGHFLYAQQKVLNDKGVVNYISNENYYLLFGSTQNIQVGDTIYTKKAASNSLEFSSQNFTPTFVVKFKSSTSILANLIVEEKPTVKMEVYSFYVPKLSKQTNKDSTFSQTEPEKTINSQTKLSKDSNSVNNASTKEQLYGRITLSDDYIVSDAGSSLSRIGARLNLGVRNINNSRISFDSYISYQHYLRTKNPRNAPNYFVGLYSLALSYEGAKHFKASLGRTVHSKLSSLGASDGIQVEQKIKKVFVGAIAGFRPSFQNYLMDFNLFQSGFYTGFEHSADLVQTQTTVGFVDQQNQWKTDRRYLAFQHSTTLRNNLTFFTSAEMDLFERMSNLQTSNQAKLTSIYVSLNYRVTKKLSLFGSYDNRRNIIYYQTYFDILDELNAYNYFRQGLRFRINFKLAKYISFSAAYNSRLNKSEKSFDNYQGSLNFTKMPGIGGSLSFSYNYNLTNYMKNQIYGARYNRNLNKLNGSFALYFRVLHYVYVSNPLVVPYQYYSGIEFTKNFKKNYNVGFNVEHYMQKFHNTIRINVRLSKTIK